MNATQSIGSQCASEDVAVSAISALRFVVLAGITIYNTQKHLPSRAKGDSIEFSHLVAAFRDFCLQEGEHMVIYFATSCALDTFTVFGTPTPTPVAGDCRADMLMSLYSAALLTFLPNAAFAYWLRSTNRKGQMTPRAGCWALAAALLATLSFWARLTAVEAFDYVDFVHSQLQPLSWPVRSVLAGLTPPVVDLCQSLILIAASSASRETRARETAGFVALLS